MRSPGIIEIYGMAVLALIAVVLFALVKGCASIGAPDGYHYRMTVYIGDRAFSGVRDVEFSSDFSLEGFNRQHYHRAKGEAIPITLPGRPVHFAIFHSDGLSPEFVALRSAARRLNPGKEDVEWSDIVKVKGAHDLPRQVTQGEISSSPYNRDEVSQTWPAFVAFNDPTDPTTMRTVDPDKLGVTRVTIEMTDDHAEKRIASAYPALVKALATYSDTVRRRSDK